MSMHQEAGSRLPLDQVWSYFIQIAKALYYLHSPDQRTDGVRGAFGHADIKPENSTFSCLFLTLAVELIVFLLLD
jgi:serine/threonine protein kinase